MMRPGDVNLKESIFVIVSPFLDSAEPPVSVHIRAQWGEALLVWELLSSCAFRGEEWA